MIQTRSLQCDGVLGLSTVNVTVAYAKLNIQLSTTLTTEEILKIESVLHDAATWSSVEDFEVFFSEKDNIAGVSIPIGEDIADVLEAGSALGICNRMFEESGLSNGRVWHSLVSVSGAEIYSPL